MSSERVIGLVLSHGYAYYRRILRGIANFADRRPEFRFVSAAPEIGSAVRELLKNVDAAIMGLCSREWWHFVRRTQARVVNIDCVVPQFPIPRIGVNNQLIGRLAAQHFLERGLRSFAFVGNPRFLFSLEREEGFRTALKRVGRSLEAYQSAVSPSFDPTGCQPQIDESVKAWLLTLPRPCGVFAPDDAFAAELLTYCSQLNIRVPEDLAVLGVDDDDFYCELSRPRMSSVIVPAESLGLLAAKAADRLIDRRQRFMSRDVLIPPAGIAVRRSTDMLAIDDADVVTAIRYIRENCHRSLSVPEVVSKVHLSRRALERRVLETLGHTLGAEIRRTRLERARHLLTESDMSIAEVAAQSGFSDFRHLAVNFRQTCGLTPTQYRRNASQSR